MGEGIGQNSSHNGFFLEAITLHLSSLKTDRITHCAMPTQFWPEYLNCSSEQGVEDNMQFL